MSNIAHRGIVFNYSNITENSIESIQNAVNLKFKIVEIDIRFTQKNFILHHDPFFIHNENIISVENYQFNDKLTLQKVFQTFNNKISFFLDIKSNHININNLINLSRQFNINNICFTSFKENHLIQICDYEQKHNIKLIKGFITSNIHGDNFAYIINKYKIDFLIISYTQITPNLVKFIHNKHVKIVAWIINNKQIKQYYKNLGVDFIMTDKH